ncbi:MAG: DUF2703 domain-containing protein [Bacilli bacterium]|jgi:hypothetical protein|nr:DUF2703 domain-containing protein [Candidatus Paceibacterota bacterium]MDY0209202.1 DUF2703 domain-containing protein [Bacilli bacterium]
MNKLIIEWKHLDIDGDTCNRCYDTGENVYNEVKRLNRSLQEKKIQVEFLDTKLDATQVKQSNIILFNGVPIEEIIDIKILDDYCETCSDLIGKETYCRAVVFDGNHYEDVPAKAIRQAAYTVLGIKEKNIDQKSSSSCCHKKGCC